MSSPIAKNKKNVLDRALINVHKKTSHNTRIALLSEVFSKEIQELKSTNPQNSIRCLDIGCGDMTLSEAISEKDNTIVFKGIDIHTVPQEMSVLDRWKNYSRFDGQHIPFEDNSFDVVLFSDVLHHDYKNIEILLSEAKRVSKYILIKDHFEYGFFSRKLLQLADIIGNYGYGISIPNRYFSIKSYEGIIGQTGLSEIKRISPIYLYKHNPLVQFLFKGKYQFISILNSDHE